ncbi:MAG: AsnC family transcriptional regulator [Spirochaetaceae bacterium]|nr:AsnC family transcriptional regulator [Spirochaetaceae bacterium]
MLKLTDIDKKILEEVQLDFPLSERTFEVLGKRIGLSEEAIISRIAWLKEENIIRDISAIFKAGPLGYKSTLVAVKTDNPETTAEKINKHSGVSHNYLREHNYNVWFTITIRKEIDFETEIRDLLGTEVSDFIILPSLKTYKIGVNFTFSDKKRESPNTIVEELSGKFPIDEKLIVQLQQPFPLVSTPWKTIAESINRSEINLIEDIIGLKRSGALKRISAVLRHRNAGFTANGMACFKVPALRIDEAGKIASEFPEVSHCYQRPVYPDWQYNLFAMTHARSTEQCEEIITTMAKQINAEEYFTLYSIKEFKKERVKYYMEDSNVN